MAAGALLMIVAAARSQPSITSVQGTARHKRTLVMYGSSFGTFDVTKQVWTGNWIEDSANGTFIGTHPNQPENGIAPGWNETLTSGGSAKPRITQVKKHSTLQSILTLDPGPATNSGFDYQVPARFDSIYMTWWAYLEPLTGDQGTCFGAQNKMWRLSSVNARVSDNPGGMVVSGVYRPPLPGCGPAARTQFSYANWCALPRCHLTSATCPAVPGEADSLGYWAATEDHLCCEEAAGTGTCDCADEYWCSRHAWCSDGSAPILYVPEDGNMWVRWEFYSGRSDLEVKNGTQQIWIDKPDSARTVVLNRDRDVCTHRDLSNHDDCITWRNDDGVAAPANTQTPLSWKWVVFQNHWMNQGIGTMNNYIDDIWITFDQGEQRVELGNDAVYANCTRREIQPILEWTAGKIRFSTNFGGSFEAGDTAYVFVVNAAGQASGGHAIVLQATPAGPGVPDDDYQLAGSGGQTP